jgi:hypothetical protein
MATKPKTRRPYVTARDIEILRALDLGPLTALQLKTLSQIWPEPLQAQRTVRDRLQQLTKAKLVRVWRYATTFPCQPTNYYTLAREGFRLLHGPDAQPPTKGHFSEVALSRQPHTRALADFIVHTHAAAHASGVELARFRRENSLRLQVGGASIFPDAAFELISREGRAYRFFVEIDGGTERLCTEQAAESWQRKIRLYDELLDGSAERFRLLVVVMHGSLSRLKHILDLAGRTVRNPERSLVYGVTLPGYVATFHAATSPIFLDHRGNSCALVDSTMPREVVQAGALLQPAMAC